MHGPQVKMIALAVFIYPDRNKFSEYTQTSIFLFSEIESCVHLPTLFLTQIYNFMKFIDFYLLNV